MDFVTAVVTGAASGIGRLSPRGWRLAFGRPAHILNSASLAGLATFAGGGAYGASKHAVVAVAEQAALALADTAVGVTLLCPALVRTGMSAEGADPAAVADEALATVRRGRFAVVPVEWHDAIVRRVQRLASGRPPTPPTAAAGPATLP